MTDDHKDSAAYRMLTSFYTEHPEGIAIVQRRLDTLEKKGGGMRAKTERSTSQDNAGWVSITVERPGQEGFEEWPVVAGQFRQVYEYEIIEDVPRPMRWLAKYLPFLRSDMECVIKGGVHYLTIHKATPFTREVGLILQYREQ